PPRMARVRDEEAVRGADAVRVEADVDPDLADPDVAEATRLDVGGERRREVELDASVRIPRRRPGHDPPVDELGRSDVAPTRHLLAGDDARSGARPRKPGHGAACTPAGVPVASR